MQASREIVDPRVHRASYPALISGSRCVPPVDTGRSTREVSCNRNRLRAWRGILTHAKIRRHFIRIYRSPNVRKGLAPLSFTPTSDPAYFLRRRLRPHAPTPIKVSQSKAPAATALSLAERLLPSRSRNLAMASIAPSCVSKNFNDAISGSV